MSPVVLAAARALARATTLTETQARGTLRLLLKERGLTARIARKADVLALLGEPLEQALASRRVEARGDLAAAIRAALDATDELDDAYDLFDDL